jgi:hypothetical protein
MLMHTTNAYVIQPRSNLIELVAAYDDTTWGGLNCPLVWLREEGDFSPFPTEYRLNFVKLIFLGHLKYMVKQDTLLDLFDAKFEISLGFFDQYWLIFRQNAGHFVDSELNSLPKEIIGEFVATGTPVDSWIEAVVAQRDG